jgi:hypothetical protein
MIPRAAAALLACSQVTHALTITTRGLHVPHDMVATCKEQTGVMMDDSHDTNAQPINLLGPPSFLASLDLQESDSIPSLLGEPPMSVTRLARSPNIYCVRNFLPDPLQRNALIHAAQEQGMKVAGTRKSHENTVRKKSFIAWLDSSCSTQQDAARFIVKNMQELAKTLFVHERLVRFAIGLQDQFSSPGYLFVEDLQVAKYDPKGQFDAHHDGFGRFVTVLTYLNGVGGTYFPFAETLAVGNDTSAAIFRDLDEASLAAVDKIPGRDGLLIVGTEGKDGYLIGGNYYQTPNAVCTVQPGDALVFYSQDPLGEKDWRSLHAGLQVPEEKWSATNWFRSEYLTGPFTQLYLECICPSASGEEGPNL